MPEYGEQNLYTADAFGSTPAAYLNAEYREEAKHGSQMCLPVDGDALAREAAAELRVKLHSIVAGPKLGGTAWVQVLP